MFTTLPESRRIPSRRAGGTAASFIAHYGLVLALACASADVATSREPPRQEAVTFQQQVPPAPEPGPSPELLDVPSPERLLSEFIAPLTIPAVIPAIDLDRTVRVWSDFAPPRSRFAEPGDAVPRQPGVQPGGVYREYEVERAAAVVATVPAEYPGVLRRAGVEGEVLVSFVVDTLGRADMSTFTVLRTTHDLFARAVREAVSRERFSPAEVGATRVRQLVQQPFAFTIVPR